MKRLLFQSGLIFFISGLIPATASETLSFLPQDLVKVFEVVIAGIIGSALVLSILALFIGRWSGKKQNTAIKKIRLEIEKDKEQTETLIAEMTESVADTQLLVKGLKNKTSAITSKQHQAWVQVEDIEEMVEDALDCSTELKQTTDGINQRMTQIQNYWDEQLKESTDVVQRVQSTLEHGLEKVELGLEALQTNEIKSRSLSQRVVEGYQQQSAILSNNAATSKKTRINLDKALEESEQLLAQLSMRKKSVETSFQTFNDDLGSYESQAYDQFDNIFQATDIARKELDANMNESRLYIDNLRRYEEEGRSIKLQTRHHLDRMSDKSMEQFSTTLENTQKMFTALQDDVQDAQYAIDSLRQMKHQILEKPSADTQVKNNITSKEKLKNPTIEQAGKHSERPEEFLAISGDSTLIPFFSGRK